MSDNYLVNNMEEWVLLNPVSSLQTSVNLLSKNLTQNIIEAAAAFGFDANFMVFENGLTMMNGLLFEFCMMPAMDASGTVRRPCVFIFEPKIHEMVGSFYDKSDLAEFMYVHIAKLDRPRILQVNWKSNSPGFDNVQISRYCNEDGYRVHSVTLIDVGGWDDKNNDYKPARMIYTLVRD